ncbi:MAG: nicotinate (nicotinamide) nucleotide adenylyltransferase [Candidatus Dormibacteraceae bacterium]
MRVGVVGGTFDPIHRGHLAMAEVARHCCDLERILIIPAADPPHRVPAIATAEHRLAMCQLAVRGHPHLEVRELELQRVGPSYTVDTLNQLQMELPQAELHLILGWDAAHELPSWERWEEVLRRARLVVVPRHGRSLPTELELSRLGVPLDRYRITAAVTPAVGATKIRSLLRNREFELARPMLTPEVADYILEHDLYVER